LIGGGAAIVAALFIGGLFLSTYIKWSKEQDKILGKLADYKRQIDFIRSPVAGENRAGTVMLGAVALPSKVFDRNGKLIGEYYTERRSLIPYEKMPQHLIKALIASEDRDFFKHEGINFAAIFRAFLRNLISLRIAQGGSTITQQLAKVLFTNQERTLKRKMFEFFCAREIEEHYTKEQILEMYLNLVYFGHGRYGVDSISRYYFGKGADKLTLGESAMLIGLLPNPGGYSPLKNLRKALERQKMVLNAMVETGFITKKQMKSAIKKFYKDWQIFELEGSLMSQIGQFPDSAYRINLAPYFLDYIRQKILKTGILDSEQILKGGLRIYTTLDYKRQLEAKRSLQSAIDNQKKYYQKIIARLKKKGKTKLAKQLERAKKETNGAFVTIEPSTGYILTMIGGYEFSKTNQFNRAVLAKRQVGSLIKPFIYYLGIFQKIITPATLVEDTPLKIGKKRFRNYDGKYLGKITARDALRKSRNTPTLRLLQKVGISSLRELIADLLAKDPKDLKKRIPQEIVVGLGTVSFTPLEMARFYASMVNKGKRVIVQDLLRVEDTKGRLLWEAEENPPQVSVMDPVAAYITITMLQGVFEEGGTAGWVAGLRKKNSDYLPFEIAGKTGTTSHYKDAWFAGLTSDEVSVIWIGTDHFQSLGKGRTGGGLCSPAWVNYIWMVREENPPPPFSADWPLDNIVREDFCNDSGGVPREEGLCPHVIHDQVFFKGTEPKFYCPLHLKKEEELLIP
ncbi:MAG: PBP1A family penicillin-binding protein, partial [Candidatus Hydrogenedentota bacterium]